jgi:hypothetical protein
MPADDELDEKLGIFRLRFALEARDGGLRMNLRRITAFGVPCPASLFPEVFAQEHGEDGKFHFEVRMNMPLVGQVVRYHGHLEMPAE